MATGSVRYQHFCPSFLHIEIYEAEMQRPSHVPSLQWHSALVEADAVCDSVRAAGGAPIDAIRAYGIANADGFNGDWEKAHSIIVAAACSQLGGGVHR